MSGFIALYRDTKDHPLFAGDSQRLGAWCWLLMTACWKPSRFNVGGTTLTLERGQLCVSRAQLSKEWGWSPSAVERFLTRLQTEQMIGRETGQGRSIVTICNYEKYQDLNGEAGQATGQATGQPPDSHRTTKEQGNKGTIIEEETIVSPSDASAGEELALVGRDEIPSPKPKRSTMAKRQSGIDTPLPENFQPSLGPQAQRIVDGWPPGMLDRELFAFCSHAEANGRLAKNWNGAFGTWIAKAEERRISNGNRSTTGRTGTARSGASSGGYKPAAGFQRRLAEARSREAAEAADRSDDRSARSNGELPFAGSRALPRE
ncbi:hypothetical protein [Novosphingobium sp. KN65.2]|uniref:hypothetical protein n=1 Tax=Novosphingobium sp. KN65.2 TaxID=1478134 RepID=UPI000A5DDD81|nr:hypothetical protein [Novosphingobium sp. KN65.2]